jgi:hypothetical protein
MVVGAWRSFGKESMTFSKWKKLSHIPVIGPSKIGAQQGSKEFAKEFFS